MKNSETILPFSFSLNLVEETEQALRCGEGFGGDRHTKKGIAWTDCTAAVPTSTLGAKKLPIEHQNFPKQEI